MTPNRASPPATPRWVKALGLIAVLVVLVLIILMLAGGEHGPARHGAADQGEPDRRVEVIGSAR
ncbi:MAG TPA: hypothetical protein VNW68_03915 [Candidatus Limnocylindria bacterium]|jgi:hypothetical protein|nr:hypothetical protein [Candidatus Limnocylindria bacterium]